MITKNVKCDCNSCNKTEASHQSENRDTKWPKPKGHLDTQLFPECEGTKYDRNIVKKTVDERKRKHKGKGKKKASVSGVRYLFAAKTSTKQPRYCESCGEYVGDLTEIQWNGYAKTCDECMGEDDGVYLPDEGNEGNVEQFPVNELTPPSTPEADVGLEQAAFAIEDLTKTAQTAPVENEFVIYFKSRDGKGSYAFPCDAKGKIDETKLTDGQKQSLEYVKMRSVEFTKKIMQLAELKNDMEKEG